jgi:uncharacterized protein (DUF2147 family)
MKKTLLAGLMAALVLAGNIGISTASAAGPEGVWRMKNGKVTVRVSYCGGTKLCATIVGLAKPLDKKGRPKVDKENPNPALRDRPVIGLTIISGMSQASDNVWKGKAYNADDGGTYSSKAEFSGNSMVVEGCWGPICKEMKFIRVN